MRKPARRVRAELQCVVLLVGLLGAIHAAEAYEVDPALVGATIGGRVTYTGSLPKPERVPVYRDSKFCGETVSINNVQVDRPSRGLEGVVISLEGIEKGKPVLPNEAIAWHLI